MGGQPQDILWRRTKLGLFTTAQEQDNVQRLPAARSSSSRSKIEAA
jgi:glycerol-3-phosphate dehydrogenase